MDILSVIILYLVLFGLMLLTKYGDGGKQEVKNFLYMLRHPFQRLH